MKNQSFLELKLAENILRAVKAEGYENPTPIQAAAIPHLLNGLDLIGLAQTGTGKTAAFALPMLHKLSEPRKKARPRTSRALVLTPTRELAAQVGESFKNYGRHTNLNHALVFGGVSQRPQVSALSRGVDILVATPGRLLDLMNQKHVLLSDIEIFVLDEADRMLDMGFFPDIKRIVAALPKKRQSLLFSATMSPEIRRLAEGLLQNPVNVAVAAPTATAANVEERVLFVDDKNKRALLSNLLEWPDVSRVLIFTRTKHGANRLVKELGHKANAIHGNKSQSARSAALHDFRSGRCKVLVATDIASRGIDVDGVTHVINYDLPNEPESYIHRIGRTARAGASGVAISFCGTGERARLRDIERLLKRSIPVHEDHPYHSTEAARVNFGKKIVSARNRNNPNQSRGHFQKPWERRARQRKLKAVQGFHA